MNEKRVFLIGVNINMSFNKILAYSEKGYEEKSDTEKLKDNIEILERKVEVYLKAAEEGDAEAQYNLGICYEEGSGVKKNANKAVYRYWNSNVSYISMAKIV